MTLTFAAVLAGTLLVSMAVLSVAAVFDDITRGD
jgi:hypothetical protein